MKKKPSIVSYSTEEITRLKEQGDDLTNWERVDRMTEAELESCLDEDSEIGPVNWATVKLGIPQRKRDVHIRLDADVLDWLKQNGKGYQTRINAILRAYMYAHINPSKDVISVTDKE